MWLSKDSPLASETVFCGGCDRFVIGGVHVGIDYLPIAEVNERLRRVLKDGDVSPVWTYWTTLGECPEGVCADIKACRPLWDPDNLIVRWQDSVRSYPRQFKLNILNEVSFEARYKLKDMLQASEIADIALFHIALSELCFCLLRMLFAINEEYFRGAKWAMRTAADFRLVPDNWTKEMEDLLCRPMLAQSLRELFLQARSLTVAIVELASSQGEEERKAIQRGLSQWPDVDPLE